MAKEESFRVMLLGSIGVGKSNIALQIVEERFVGEYDPTIEDAYRIIYNADNRQCAIEIYDTAEGYHNGYRGYMRRTDGFIIVYDITQLSTFEAVQSFNTDIDVNRPYDITKNVVLVGNKCDLNDSRQVSTKEGKDMAAFMKCPFFEVSAKKRINIDECFVQVIRMIRGFMNNMSKKEKKAFIHSRRSQVACVLL
eukprot:TRINITY_DN2062_c0_g1_i12.p1 TRINITY_DN2062_c0_g1~~TRINITY_DN2062_c0_g1_i12.p1  ORF type:complete len:195 (-),score=28.08 TRINITY_DN2062_c0_g1_i12:287-871(-)